MRLIDADKLTQYMKSWYLAHSSGLDDFRLKFLYHEFTDQMIHYVDDCATVMQKYGCNYDCDALYKAYQKGREDALKEIKK